MKPTIAESNIATLSNPERKGATYGANVSMLATKDNPELRDDDALWIDAINALLSWRKDPSQFDDDDRPDAEIVDSAIDLAYDQQAAALCAPDSIIPSGSGNIAFQWNVGDETKLIELHAPGRFRFTFFKGGRVVARGQAERNPITRRIELTQSRQEAKDGD